ncbi:MAG: small subunit ribosomal protein S3Ae [Methanothermococcus sp.]|jgi:small subunit ribosomal protein S3Ae|uniref:30S ribosomal protein S3ae n=1 Tax=Methanothermococcus TaxID=155862 RepID=UPI00037B817F|nr:MULTISPECIES: 30S ribosomal protein S3ae [Methanothermococcus]MDK2789501.1 small subunit ribosomal protein S3Ae [Methanothermococcus sp.]MDK2988159.1 small subunit ribosomal protein S3Ae [Methanothermococcus sp.]
MARMKARSGKGRRVTRDTWKTKVWYDIRTPQVFGGDVIGQTPSNDPSLLIGRVAEISLRDLTNDHTKHMVRMYFKIDGVSGNNATTQFVGHDTTREYLKSQIRRRRSKIDTVVDVRTKDGYKIRVKAIVLTAVRARDHHKTEIRKKMEEIIRTMAKESTFPEYVQAMLLGGLGSKIYGECKKMFPLRRVEVYKSEVLEFGKPLEAKAEEETVEEEKQE